MPNKNYIRIQFFAILFCVSVLLFSACSKDGTELVIPEIEQPSGEQQTIEQQVIDIVNRERSDAGLNKLQKDESLMTSCDVRAKELPIKLSHTRPDDTSWSTAITTTYSDAGENIASGYASAEAVMVGWMNSLGHRNNILKKNYTHIGVGYYKQGGTSYWVQLFIRR